MGVLWAHDEALLRTSCKIGLLSCFTQALFALSNSVAQLQPNNVLSPFEMHALTTKPTPAALKRHPNVYRSGHTNSGQKKVKYVRRLGVVINEQSSQKVLPRRI